MSNYQTIVPGARYEFQTGSYLSFMTAQHPGVLNEDVIEVLIDRIDFLNKTLPCNENILAIQHLTSALDSLNARSKRIADQFELLKDIDLRKAVAL